MEKRLAKGIRKFIRSEKARLRGEFSDSLEANAKINGLVAKFYAPYNKEAIIAPKVELKKEKSQKEAKVVIKPKEKIIKESKKTKK